MLNKTKCDPKFGYDREQLENLARGFSHFALIFTGQDHRETEKLTVFSVAKYLRHFKYGFR